MTREQFIREISGEQESIRRFLLPLCGGDAFTADDIAQDAMVKAWMAMDSFRGASKLSTWLFRIAYNCWCNRKYANSSEDLDTPEAMHRDSGVSSDGKFRYEPLYQAISTLKPKEKAAILLFYMEDKDIKEIAAIMDVPTGTVKSLLSRGRENLRIKMK